MFDSNRTGGSRLGRQDGGPAASWVVLRRILVVFVLIATALVASPSGADPDPMNDGLFSSFSIPVSVFPDAGAIELAGTYQGTEGMRYGSKSEFMYHKPLNIDAVVFQYGGPRACYGVASQPQQIEHGARCSLVLRFTNPTSVELDNVTVAFSSDNTGVTHRFEGRSYHDDVAPGEAVDFEFTQAYGKIGRTTDTYTVSGSLWDPVTQTRLTFSTSPRTDYTVMPRTPTAPVAFNYVFTDNTYTAYWNPPVNDGGYPVTGYLVELIQHNPDYLPWEPGEPRWISEQTACNFAGRPELTVCDMPNNTITRMEAGTDYRFRVRALTDYVPATDYESAWAPVFYSEPFDIAYALDSTPTPVPQPTPTPDPVPEPDPVPDPVPTDDVIVVVPDYSMAPNLVSVIHATNYSNDLDAPVLRLYQAYFNREPDLLGIKYWLDVRRSGHRLLAIAGFMAGSREFANNYQGVSDVEYLTRVYRNMLGRDYDQAGFNYWLDAVRGTNDFGGNPRYSDLSRAEVVFYVTGGEEFIRNYPYTND